MKAENCREWRPLLGAYALGDLPAGERASLEEHLEFASLPQGVKIDATLEPHAYGTEIHMYVKGIRSGTLCRVYMRGRGGNVISAGTFRYRWGGDASAVLSAALDLSRARELVVHAGDRTFVAPIGTGETAVRNQPQEEEPT